MNEITLEMLIVYSLIAIGILCAISYFLFRWIFSVKRQLWNQQATIKLLIMLVEKQGGGNEETAQIKEQNNVTEENKL